MTKKINNFLFFIGLFIIYALYSNIIVLILKYLGLNINKLDIHHKNIYLILIDISLMIITYLIYRKELNNELNKYLKHFKRYFFFGFKMWLIGLILMISSNIIISIIYPQSTATNEETVQNMLKQMPIYMTFAACIFAPFMEEIVFRKSLKKVFNSNLLFIIVSGLLFGLAHNLSNLNNYNIIYIIPYGLFGSIFAYTYIKTKNIFVPMTFHFIHNTTLIIISLSNMGVFK